MCLATIYSSSDNSKPVYKEISHLRIDNDKIEIETLFGEGEVIQGKITEIDFMKSTVVITL